MALRPPRLHPAAPSDGRRPSRLTAAPGRGLVAPMRSARVVAAFLLLGALACSRGGRSVNLIDGKPPARVDGVTKPQLLTDGRQAAEGEAWDAPAAAILQSERAFVDYDLGQPAPIDSAYLQGDNNDEYVVSVSDDGTTFR